MTTTRSNFQFRALSRAAKRGSVLTASLLFFVLVTVAGVAALSMSQTTRLGFVRSSLDVRMMIAAEAGIESVRGRFTLVAGVQDDWSALVPSAGWNDLETMTINGIEVETQAMPVGGPGVLQARIRAIARIQQRNRVVEYTIQAANFADYALYFGSNNTVSIGEYFKMVGNFYSVGNLNLHNRPGIEFFSRVETSSTVMNAPDPVYNFKEGYTQEIPIVTIPPTAYGLTPMRTAAQASTSLFYSNTMSIQLVGEQFIRTYRYRVSGTGFNYNQNHHEVRTEVLDIPDNSVIYIDSDLPPLGVDSYSIAANAACQYSTNDLSLWGVLDERRVTIACEHFITVPDIITYQTLLDNPDYRRFTVKKTAPALAYREMLGVLSMEDITFATPGWTALPNGSIVTDDASLTPPDTGHYASQYTLDGVYMGVGKAARGAVGPATGRELWVCGGIINLTYPSTLLASNFDRRNYDTDYRLRFTTPPYFLNAYGTTATMIAGTWRTYEL